MTMARVLIFLLLSTTLWAEQPDVTSVVVRQGFGREAQLGDRVAISYVLKLADGSIVDKTASGSNYSVTLGEGKVVPGLEQALVGMRRGEKRHLEIPAELGYGSQQTGAIPPNSILFFDVELKAIAEERHQRQDDDEDPHHEHDHNDTSHQDQDHDHDHDHSAQDDHGHSHSSNLPQTLGKEGYESRPDAHNLDTPAMFEYMVRDFYTRPWRYDDTTQSVWKANAVLTLIALGVALLTALLERSRRESV